MFNWAHATESQDGLDGREIEPLGFDGTEARPPTPIARARTFCELGRYGEAVAAVGEIISREPRNEEAWCLMAQAQLGSERPGAALEAARAAASLGTGREEPHRLASVALIRLGRQDEAAEAALAAIQSEPESWEAHACLAHSLAGSRNRLDEAREAADTAVALSPDEPGPHLASGTVAMAAGRRADAASAFCAALAADPLCGEAHHQLVAVEALGPRRGPSVLFSRLSGRLGKRRAPKFA